MTSEKSINTDRLRRAIVETLLNRDPGKSICPSEAARNLAGPDEKQWRLLMKPIRQVAVDMAKAGEIRILRKGKDVADPDDFRGVYRLALPGPSKDQEQ
ncbi:DUF3253 domain-containing protein [Hoeflea sp.]|uniref:DUF3253 domain-containing protein n=1 Tax=Hoeflea sp. TaxID=1940281 RepID=UPI003B526ABA